MTIGQYCVDIKGLVFNDQGWVLLLQEPNGMWDLPGGLMEHGENFNQTLIRECREEVGVTCTIVDTTPYLSWSVYANQQKSWFIYLCFRITLESYNFTNSDECIGYNFFDSNTFQNIRLKDTVRPLQEYLQNREA